MARKSLEQRIQEKQTYSDRINRLSNASVHGRHVYNAYKDIDWNDPEYEIDETDPRWILGEWDTLGGHEWYKNLPPEEQARIGLKRIANACLVGLQFEELLCSGMMHLHDTLPPDSDEARYIMHEVTEESWHIQMFREFVKKSGVKPKGAPYMFRTVLPYLTPLAKQFPEAFMTFVLAGEEPVDNMQHAIIREDEANKDSDDESKKAHPLIRRVMDIHTREEARHINFANLYLERHIGTGERAMNFKQRLGRRALGIAYPLIMRYAANTILKPSDAMIEDMGIPPDVARQIWWDSDHSQSVLHNLVPRARALADRMNLREGRVARATWKLMRLDEPRTARDTV